MTSSIFFGIDYRTDEEACPSEKNAAYGTPCKAIKFHNVTGSFEPDDDPDDPNDPDDFGGRCG